MKKILSFVTVLNKLVLQSNKSFEDCSSKRKEQRTNLQMLYSSVSVNKEGVSIDPLTPFLRLAVAVERKAETKIETFITSWHHTPYLCLVLWELLIIKPHWKIHLLEQVATREVSCGVSWWRIFVLVLELDEEWSSIFQKYSDKCRHLRISIIVIDGYASSTKYATHKSNQPKYIKLCRSTRIIVVRLREQNS